MTLPAELAVSTSHTLRDAMRQMDRGGKGIVLVISDGKLVATLTDGDLRRALIAGLQLTAQVSELLRFRESKGLSGPLVTAKAGTPTSDLLKAMEETGVSQIPLIDEAQHVCDLVTLHDLLPPADVPVQAVIMAGGFGKRLRPLTDQVPKPMLRVAGKPIMERTIEKLRDAGIRTINVTTHYLPEKIKEHFGDGRNLGVDLSYVSEDQPLGTAGALQFFEDVQDTMLVINGDILTSTDFRALLKFHREQSAQLTVGARHYGIEVPYGVIEAQDGTVTALTEKPTLDFLVNAGIYLIEPQVRQLLTVGQRCDMTDLIQNVIDRGGKVSCFPIFEYWLDIGRQDDFERAQQEVKDMKWAA